MNKRYLIVGITLILAVYFANLLFFSIKSESNSHVAATNPILTTDIQVLEPAKLEPAKLESAPIQSPKIILEQPKTPVFLESDVDRKEAPSDFIDASSDHIDVANSDTSKVTPGQTAAPKYKAKNHTSQDIKIIGETSVVLPVNDLITGSSSKEIKVLNVEVSDNYLQNMEKRAETIDKDNKEDGSDFDKKSSVVLRANDAEFNLGMNGVPVFDQGNAGTCVTFAATAALDAKLMAGDLISQQCLLELGTYLAANSTSLSGDDSGWDGFYNSDEVLSRIKKYGIVDKNTCPHPYISTVQTYQMSPNQYVSLKYDLGTTKINWKSLYANDVNSAKKALSSGHRLLIGTMVDLSRVVGSPINAARNGLWEIPQGMSANQYLLSLMNYNLLAGHAVVITGYDDHRKLFKIRNSWGTTVGDQGEFYMTYDFYKLMNMETFEILD